MFIRGKNRFAWLLAWVAVTSIALADERVTLATVDGRPITDADVRREMSRAIGDRQFDQSVQKRIEQQVLRQLIDRRRVEAYLERQGEAAGEAEVDRAVERLRERLKQSGQTLDDYLEQNDQTLDELRGELAWRAGWRRYVARHVTDETLKALFERRRREFDGTELRVRHILLPHDQIDQAEALRRRITKGEIAFADAARQWSKAPTADEGGDIGFIRRHGQQVESFAKAAFALEEIEVSEPVVTPFGVHLIQWTQAKPGEKTWRHVRDELHRAAALELFRDRADRQTADGSRQ